MSEVFEAKIRKIGNAKGIIIPNEILERIHAVEGENIKLIISQSRSERIQALRELSGKYPDSKKFKREERDRY